MKRILMLFAVAALALSVAAVALAGGPAGHHHAARLGAPGSGGGTFTAWREWLKQQGLPERPARGAKLSDADRAKLKDAFEACKSVLPAPVRAAQDAFGKYRECLKQQGLPERPARGAKLSDADRAKLKDAFEACKSTLPQRPHSSRSTMRHR